MGNLMSCYAWFCLKFQIVKLKDQYTNSVNHQATKRLDKEPSKNDSSFGILTAEIK